MISSCQHWLITFLSESDWSLSVHLLTGNVSAIFGTYWIIEITAKYRPLFVHFYQSLTLGVELFYDLKMFYKSLIVISVALLFIAWKRGSTFKPGKIGCIYKWINKTAKTPHLSIHLQVFPHGKVFGTWALPTRM